MLPALVLIIVIRAEFLASSWETRKSRMDQISVSFWCLHRM